MKHRHRNLDILWKLQRTILEKTND